MHSFGNVTEATEKLKKNSSLEIIPGVGAFEQLFGPVRGEFEQKFFKNSNARGVARRGMLKLRFDWYMIVVNMCMSRHVIFVTFHFRFP